MSPAELAAELTEITPESAYYAMDGPKEQAKSRLGRILRILGEIPTHEKEIWHLDLETEAIGYLEEIESRESDADDLHEHVVTVPLGPCSSCHSREAISRKDGACEGCGHAIDYHAATLTDAYAVECGDHDHAALTLDEARHWLDLDVILARYGVEPESDLTSDELRDRLRSVGANGIDAYAAQVTWEARS